MAAILAALVVAGAVYSWQLGPDLRYHDEAEYVNLAASIARGDGFSFDGERPTAFRPPGYPAALAPFLWLGLPIEGLRALQFALLAASSWILYRMVRQAVSCEAGVLALLMAALYPVAFYTAGTFYPQTLTTWLFLAALLLLERRPTSYGAAALAGVLWGWLVLTVPTFALTLSLLAATWLLRRERGELAPLAVAVLVSVLVVGAWTLRNRQVFGETVFISTNSGINLLLGNSEATTPNAGVNVDLSAYEGGAKGLEEVALDRYYRDQALEWVREHPDRALSLFLRKTANHFNYTNELATIGEASRTHDLLMLVSYGPLLLLFGARWALVRRLPPLPIETLFAFLYVTNAFVSALFFTRIRFRVPFDFLLIGSVAIFLARLRRARGLLGSERD